MDKEKLLLLREALLHETSLTKLCTLMDMTELELMGYVNALKNEGDNLTVNRKNNEIFIIDQGDNGLISDDVSYVNVKGDEIRLAFVSDTRLCSKYQQLSILNDIYKKAASMGVTDVIHCGDISEGDYAETSVYNSTVFVHDVYEQAEYIATHYPQVEGITTHFITGEHDKTHIKMQKVDIGKCIDNKREDMDYLGRQRKKVVFKDENNRNIFSILVLHPTGKIPYTISYKPQQFIHAMRSEDKVDILLHGHWLQTENLTYRGIEEFSVPSVVATTPEMIDKGDQNTIGAWIVSIKLNKKKKIESITPIFLPYYKVITEDYQKARVLSIGGKYGK